VLVVEHEHFGGQITITSEVVNYPGVLSASGEQLTVTMRRQAEAFGAEMLLATVESLDVDGDDPAELPFVEVARADGAPTGMRFHGVSGGHEFTSFVLGLYNASGPGQPIANEDRNAIESIARPVRLRVPVGLSCTMCLDVVVACQRMAADNPLVEADAYDINRFSELRERYDVMSVPCLVVNDGAEGRASFGQEGALGNTRFGWVAPGGVVPRRGSVNKASLAAFYRQGAICCNAKVAFVI
jgi:thioredoxin reductase (NADPH)